MNDSDSRPLGSRTVQLPGGTITFDIPVIDNRAEERASQFRRIDVQWRTSTPSGRKRCIGLALLFDGLVAACAKTSDGRPVTTKTDALAWLLEAVADGWRS